MHISPKKIRKIIFAKTIFNIMVKIIVKTLSQLKTMLLLRKKKIKKICFISNARSVNQKAIILTNIF